jgi:hypothetical protein
MSKSADKNEHLVVSHNLHSNEHGKPDESWSRRFVWIMISGLVIYMTALIVDALVTMLKSNVASAEEVTFNQWVAVNHQAGLVLHREQGKSMPFFVGDHGYTLRTLRKNDDTIEGEMICSALGHRVGRFKLSFTVKNRLSMAMCFDDGAIRQIELSAAK